jgi:hypothetical protein
MLVSQVMHSDQLVTVQDRLQGPPLGFSTVSRIAMPCYRLAGQAKKLVTCVLRHYSFSHTLYKSEINQLLMRLTVKCHPHSQQSCSLKYNPWCD